jgi:hypothetical protein
MKKLIFSFLLTFLFINIPIVYGEETFFLCTKGNKTTPNGPSTFDTSSYLNNITTLPGWSGLKIFSAGGCIKIGSADMKGYIITPELDLTNTTYIKFKAGYWNNPSETKVIQVFLSTDSGKTWIQKGGNITLLDTNFTNYQINFTGGNATSKIKISAKNINKNRFFLDDVMLSDNALPITLESFIGSVVNNNVNLTWKTGSETNNSGFEVYRNDQKIGFITGKGTTNEEQSYSYSDKNLQPGKYSYKLKQVDYNGNFEYYNLSNQVVITAPKKFTVGQNYPNPFNPVTKIAYSIPMDSKVTIKIFDVLGREVYSLDQQQLAGYHDFPFDASNFSSGIYFYKITAGDFTAIKKMLFIK